MVTCRITRVLVAAMIAGSFGIAVAGTAPLTGPVLPSQVGDAALGRRLFLGRVPVHASMRGEVARLPTSVSRCINCHSAPGQVATRGPALAPVSGAAPPWSAFAARRGGPAFAYDAASLCHTLRTGIDPQQVWLARAMPQFRVTPEQCAALWAYLTQAAP